MCSWGITFGVSCHRVDHVVGEIARVRAGEAHPLEPVDLPAGAQQLAEGQSITERAAVGVDVLPEQRDLDDALVDERADLGEHVAGPAVGLTAAQRGHDAERAGVVAADRDRHPGTERLTRGASGARTGSSAAPRRSRPGPRRLCRARSSSTGSAARLWVPNTTSTHGALSTIAPRSFWARQPPTAICMSGLRALAGYRWPRLPYRRLSAFSRTAQVLNTTRSTSSPRPRV